MPSARSAEHVDAAVFRNYPYTTTAVLGQPVRILNLCIAAFQLVCLLHVIVHAVDAVARRRDEYLAVLALDDAGHESRHLLSGAVNHRNLHKPAALVALQGVRHTYIYITAARLHDTVHTVVRQASRTLEGPERITVVGVQTVHRGYPDATLLVLEHLVDDTAW